MPTIEVPSTEEIQVLIRQELRQVVREEIARFFAENPIQPQTEKDEIGGVKFASRIVGKAVPTIYDLVHKRLIPHSKQGKQLYFSKNELLDWIRDGKRETKNSETYNNHHAVETA